MPRPDRRPPREFRPAKGQRPPRPPKPTNLEPVAPDERGERLQKVLAAQGLGSRRDCEELIVTGRVEIDRKVVTALGTRVDLDKQEVRVDGVSLRGSKRLYFMLNKPPGVVSTNRDPSGRPRVIDLIKTDSRLFPVGRLDRTSEGLILVTNDGNLANGLTHPRYGIEKTYLALVAGHPDQKTLDKLRYGVRLAEGFAKAASVKVKRGHPRTTELIIVLDEGRNRQIRRMLARVGHKVLQLKRIAVGPLQLGDLPTGAHRKLTPQEVQMLEAAIQRQRQNAGEKKRPPEGGGRPSKPGKFPPRSRPAGRPSGQAGPTRPAESSRKKASRGPHAGPSKRGGPLGGSTRPARQHPSQQRPQGPRPAKSAPSPIEDNFPLPTDETYDGGATHGAILSYDDEEDEQ